MSEKRSAVLVTGGAVRIGKAICLALSDGGYDVVVHYRRSAEEASELVELLGRRGGRAVAVGGDLDTEEGCERVMNEAWEAMDGLHALVNNAAVFHRIPLLETSEDDLMSEIRHSLFRDPRSCGRAGSQCAQRRPSRRSRALQTPG
ncbi:MAG: SDR family NAD(P)-dependent oxidoreductase, partial [Lentisphaerae bacterium]|nr:SDR family NAD(P)-dependent oxidoreductase [Lentisphaerota bacterium]